MTTTLETIVGRDAELAAVERFLDAVPARPGAIVIQGEAGIGKSTLWRAGIEAATRRSFTVLQAQPTESETKLSYAAMADLVSEAFDATRDSLPAPQRRALELTLLRTDINEPADARAIMTGLVSVLTALAARGPTVVAVEDVQWLDRPSERALAFAARRLPASTSLLLTRRTAGDATLPLGLDRAPPPERVERVELGPLSLGSLYHLIREQLGISLARPAMIRLEQASRGNPFFALEVARALGPNWAPALGDVLPLPADLDQLVVGRIRRLPRATRDALLVVSALTRPTTDQVTEADLEPARDAGIVRSEGERLEFVHPLFGSAVYASAPTSRRRDVHARLAESVDDLEERARHLALATRAPNEEVATLLDAAAARARERGAPDAAGELQERAASITPVGDPQAANRRTISAAEHFFHAGDLRHAQALLKRTLAQDLPPLQRADALRLLGELRYSENSFPAAIPLLEEALSLAHDPAVATQIGMDLAFAYNACQNQVRAEHYAGKAVAQAEQLGDGPLADALAVEVMIGYMGSRGINREKLERALELEEPDRQAQLSLRPSSIAAMLAVSDGRLSEGVGRIRAIRSRGIERGEESELPLLLAYLAVAEWSRGKFAAALEAAEELIRISTQSGNEPMRAVGLLHRAMVGAFRGTDASSARTDIEEARLVMARTGWAIGASYVPMVLGFLELSLGDAVAAATTFGPLIEDVERGGGNPEVAVWAPHAVDALLATGDVTRAESLVAAITERERTGSGEWSRTESQLARSRILAVRGDTDGALASIEQALSSSEQLEMPFVVGCVHLTKGRLHRKRREKRHAREALAQALQIFADIGADPWAERARGELARVGLRRAEGDALTETERRIAELAATGLTNREIAQVAFVSPKTVEANLARVYRKLGIRSRAELGARMSSPP